MQESFKIFQSSFGQERKKERENVIFFSLRPLLLPSPYFLYSCLFLPASIIIRYHSIPSPIPSLPPPPPPPLTPRSYFDSFPHFNPLLSTLCIFFYCFPLNYGNQLKLRGLLLKALNLIIITTFRRVGRIF